MKSKLFKKLFFNWKSRHLKVDIMTEFFIVPFIIGFVILTYTYQNNQKVVLEFSKTLLKQATKSVKEKTIFFHRESENLAKTAANLGDQESDITVNNQSLIQFAIESINHHHFVNEIYFSFESGGYFGIRRPLKFELDQIDGKKDPKLVKYIAYSRVGEELKKPDTFYNIYYFDANGKVISKIGINDNIFHPHEQSWYTGIKKGAVDTYWSDPYFNSNRQMTFTVSRPYRLGYDNKGQYIGVAAIDITLEATSKFLSREVQILGTEYMIVDETGAIIATSHEKNYIKHAKQDTLKKVSQIEDKKYYKAFQNFRYNKKFSFSFDHNGKKYLTQFELIPSSHQSQWYLIAISEKKNITSAIDTVHNRTLLMLLLLSSFALLANFLLTKRISQPIMRLAEEANKIKEFDLSGDFKLKSYIKEIQVLDKSISKMKQSLRAFAKFIPKDLVKSLMGSNYEVELGGSEREITLMFTDIVGFTSIAEKMDSGKLLLHFSEYLENLTDIIMQEQGAIDKYIGDAIMCFWNAPNEQKEHVYMACRAALLCRLRVRDLNRQWKLENKPILLTRIGVHVGPAIVGNIGSDQRMNYTALGDTVNTAERLEGINKYYGTRIMVSEEIYKRVKEQFLFCLVDKVRPYGKSSPYKVYSLLGQVKGDSRLAPSDRDVRYAKDFTKGVELYLSRKWEQSLKIFEELKVYHPEDMAIDLYIQRCRAFKKTPPPKNWDGVFQTKKDD